MFWFPFAQTSAGADSHGAALPLKLTGELIGLARAADGNDHMVTESTTHVMVEGLAALNKGNMDGEALRILLDRVVEEKRKLVPNCFDCACPCGRTDSYDLGRLQNAGPEVRSLKTRLLSGIADMAARVHHAAAQGRRDESVHRFLYTVLFAIGMDDWGVEELRPILQEMERIRMAME